MKSVKAFAPATLANFNVGYDVLGLSLNNVGDEVEVSFNNGNENRITEIINGDKLPKIAEKNCCTVVIRRMQEALDQSKTVDVRINKGFASGSGMGSSSASSAAAAYAYNELIGRPFSNKELVAFAAEGERIACGVAHADNVAPSILGGIILVKGLQPDDLIELPVPEDLDIITLFPKIKINTSESRLILKDHTPLNVASRQVGLMGAFVSSLYENNLDRFSATLVDLFVEPTRSLLIPKFNTLKELALGNGSLAFGISGSGPSVFAMARRKDSHTILEVLTGLYHESGIEHDHYINSLEKNSGARIIEP